MGRVVMVLRVGCGRPASYVGSVVQAAMGWDFHDVGDIDHTRWDAITTVARC
jgi:hypothetical protein